jgi:GcrA cell cycle regulator
MATYEGASAHQPTWTRDRLVQLKQLWNEGIVTAEIGRRLGVSKNAVIGKAHRLGLTPRVVHPPRHTIDRTDLFPDGCMWPLGHPTDAGFRFCGEERVKNVRGHLLPYCAAHAAKAYQKPKPTDLEREAA